ncbi:hypothetical protein [Arsenicicoccus dermatophilus]|uniref:hypothetical protein n=1 Tax=Arsenicicoccus dermatophilus TaxID=1076331 RepID=UPI001F4C8D7E|nr:hypothetical protein [Arsenicicoccus dermatophilus]MCH8614363.1 hypothetical protein [Arsenicicoccus dermatophilus]
MTTAVLARSGRAHALLARAQQDALTALPVLPWTVDDIPQVAWACALPPHRRDDTRPDQLLQRAVLAIICARMHTGADWPTSGALLGYPPDKARQWTRYCFSSAFPGLKDDLLAAAHQLAAVLPTQTTPDAWQHRPEVPNAHGMGALRHAQTPACRHDDPTSPWCPCAPPTPRNTRAQEQ